MATDKMTQVDALQVVVDVLTKNGSYSPEEVQQAVETVYHIIDVKKNAIVKKSNTVSKTTIENKKLAAAVRDFILDNGNTVSTKAIVNNVKGVGTSQKLTAIVKTSNKYSEELGFKLVKKHSIENGGLELTVE